MFSIMQSIVKPDVQNEIFSVHSSIVKETESETKYQIPCDTSNGFMHCYHLFPGIDLAYSTFEAFSCSMRDHYIPNVLEIAFCRTGRFECEYKHGYMTYLGEGDFAVSILSPEQEPPVFPLGYYDGIALIVNMNITSDCFHGIVEDVSINFRELTEKFCSQQCCTVIKTPDPLLHVFNEIYQSKNNIHLGYLRLKVLECFYLLSQMIPQENFETARYYSAAQIRKVKAIKRELLENLTGHDTLQNFAQRYDMSLTALKDCFKAVYGKPIHAFQREYKMQAATKLLISTSLSITEIAGRLGYENPNKFSTSFKEIIGQSPSEYRKQRK